MEDRRPGHGAAGAALDTAAALAYPDAPADAADLAEDAHARLAGSPFSPDRAAYPADLDCGPVRRGNRVGGFRPGAGYRTQAEAVSALEAAAALLDVTGGVR